MKLLAITDPGCAASTRYRVTQFGNYFQQHGVQIQAVNFSREEKEIARLLELAAQADVVVFQRFLPRTSVLKKFRQRAKRLVFDFDDAVTHRESARGARVNLRRWWRFRQMVRGGDAVTAGNDYLSALAARHADARRVFTVPTVVDLEKYEREPATADAALTLGWIGGRSTLPYLEKLREPLGKLSEEFPGLVVRAIADKMPELGKTRAELAPWSEATEARDLKKLSAGLAPLPDDAWTRGKCGLRLIQYLAAGIPAVAAPVGTQEKIIRLGAALPATSDVEWRDAIRKILAEKKFADELAAKGKQVVREHFSLAAWSPQLLKIWCGQ
jgi:glycosyltransferase involved in cell wall biosynthesis